MKLDYVDCSVCGKHQLGKQGKCLSCYVEEHPPLPPLTPEQRELAKQIEDLYAMIKAGEMSVMDTLNVLLEDFKRLYGKDYNGIR